MLLKAPIHNLTLSLICRFEVNCLHINPIIGEMLLIYINFQQNFPYFSSYDNFYCIKICLPTAYFTYSRCVLKCGFPKFWLFFSKRPAGFHCHKRPSPTFTNIWSHCPWALQSAAPVLLTRGMLLLTKAKRPLKFKMLCGFNKHAVKLRMHKAVPYAFPLPVNTF